MPDIAAPASPDTALPPGVPEGYQLLSTTPAAPPTPPAPPGVPEGFVPLTPDQWDATTMTEATKRGEFNPVQWAIANRDKALSPEVLKKLSDARHATREQGITARDVGTALKNAPTALGNVAKSTVEFAMAAPLALPGVSGDGGIFQAAKEAYPEAGTPEEREAKIDAEVAAGRMGKAKAWLMKRALSLGDKVASGTLGPEITAGVESSLQGLAEMVYAGGRKLKDEVGFAPKTDEDKKSRFIDELSDAEMMKAASEGEGPFTQFMQGAIIKDLEAKGVKLDPEMIATFAEGNPLVLVAFGAGFKGAGAIINSTGKVVARVTDVTKAGRTLATLKAAQSAYLSANARAAGLASAENIAGAEAAAGAVRAAKANLTTGGKMLRGAEAVSGALKAAPATMTGYALGSAGKLSEIGAKVVGWAGKSAPILGLAKGFMEGGPIGALAGLKAGEMSSGVIRRGAEWAGKKAAGVTEFGKEIIGRTAAGPTAQLAGDTLAGAAAVAGSAAKGLSLDIGLTAATSESPEQTAGMVPFGAALGGLHAVPRAVRAGVQGQLIKPRSWGGNEASASRGYGNFPALDALNAEAQGISSQAVKQRLGALRDFAGPKGVEVYQMPNRGALESFLVDYYQGRGWSAEKALGQAKVEAGNAAVAKTLIGADGKPRNVSLLVDPAPAPHEAGHGLRDVVGAAGAAVIDKLIFDEYAPVWESVGSDYANRLTGGNLRAYESAGETWRDAILDLTGEGENAGRDQLAQDTFANAKKLGSPISMEEAIKMANADYTNAVEVKGQSSGDLWREILRDTPDVKKAAADNYIAGELTSENFDTLFKHENPGKPAGNSVPEKLARIVSNIMERLGTDPYEGAKSEGLGIQPKRQAMETIRKEFSGIRPKAEAGKPTEAPKAPTEPPKPGAPEPVTENQTRAQEAAAAAGDARVAELVNRIVANQQTGDAPLRLTYKSVKGLPGGAAEAFRTGRRTEQEAAYIKEALSSMGTDTRNAVQKIHAHTRFDYVRGGKEIQSIGYSLEKLIGNVQRTVDWIRKSGNTELAAQIPYERNTFGTSLSETGWNEFISDVQRYAENQQKGGTGAGAELKLPADADAMGVTVPAFEGMGAMKPITQTHADFINMLMGFKLPETTRLSRKGGTPGNVVAQRIAGANEQPFVTPRVSEPATPRGEGKPFKGFSESIKEVNPVRSEFESKGFPVRELVEVVERINLKHLDAVTPAPEVGFKAGVTDTIRAGFMPEKAADIINMPGEKFAEETSKYLGKDNGGGLTGMAVDYGSRMTEAQRADFQQGIEGVKAKVNELMDAGDFQGAMDVATKGQFFREAIESATGGSAGQFVKAKVNKAYRGALEPMPEAGRTPAEVKVRAEVENRPVAVGEISGFRSYTEAQFMPEPAGFDTTPVRETYGKAIEEVAGDRNIWVRQSADKGNENRVLLVQLSSKFMQTEGAGSPEASGYYDNLYAKREGYTRAPDFWEVPKWQAVATHALGDRADTYVVRNMAEAKKFLKESGYGNVAFSVLDANRANVLELAKEASGRVNLGGYTKGLAADAKGLPNAKAFESMKDFVEDLGIEYKSGEDYRNFRGTSVIPRLSLSEGCRHSCTFCSVERKVKTIPSEQVDAQVDSFKDLNANLVYLNDKTFGQAENYKQLPELAERLRKDNPNFGGFVVQTTAAQMKSLTPEYLRESGIKFVEIGVESYNDAILKNSRKPASEKLIDEAIDKLRAEKIAVIPNIVIGLPGETAETYARTMDFLRRNRDAFSHVNAYNLAVYEGTELSKSLKVKTTADRDENVGNKSFHSDPKLHEDFASEVYKFANEQLDRTPYQAMPEAKGKEVRELPVSGKAEFWLRPDGSILQEEGKSHFQMAVGELGLKKKNSKDVEEWADGYREMYSKGYIRGARTGLGISMQNPDTKTMSAAQRATTESLSFSLKAPALFGGKSFGYKGNVGEFFTPRSGNVEALLAEQTRRRSTEFDPDRQAAAMPEDLEARRAYLQRDQEYRDAVAAGTALPRDSRDFWLSEDGKLVPYAGLDTIRKEVIKSKIGKALLKERIDAGEPEWRAAENVGYDMGYVKGVRGDKEILVTSGPDASNLTSPQLASLESFREKLGAKLRVNEDTTVPQFSEDFPKFMPTAMPEKPLFEPSPADEANAAEHRKTMKAYEQRESSERKWFADRMARMDYLRGQATGDLIEKNGEDAWYAKPIREREDAIFDRMVELNGGSEDFTPRKGKTQFMPTAEEWEAKMAAKRAGKVEEVVQEAEEAVGIAGTVQLKRDKKLPGSMGGVLKLIHFGAAGLAETNPKMMGKGVATPTDMAGSPKTFFFNEGSKMQADLGLRDRYGKYGVRVDGKSIYDLNADVLDILSDPNRQRRDETLKKAGYNGFHVSVPDGREVTVLYKPVAVTPIELGRAPTRAVSAPGSKFMPEMQQETFLEGIRLGKKEYDSGALQRMNREQLKEHYPEAILTKTIGEELTSDHLASPRYREAGSHEAAVKSFADKLVEYYNANKNDPAQKAGEKWYSDFTPLLKKEFGADAPIFAELLAATSPNTTPTVNFGFAQDAFNQFKSGRFDKKVAKFVEGMEKLGTGELKKLYDRDRKAGKTKDNPISASDATHLAHWIDKHDLILRGAGGNRFGMHSLPVLQVLARKWLSSNRGPKTLNFVQNLLGTGHEATIDVWADRTLRRAGHEGYRPRWRITPENSTGVPDVDFNFGQEVFAVAAKKLGIKADALQGALWFTEKKHWSDNGWGRLDLGDYRSEMENLPLLRRGTEQRLKHAAAMEKAKRMEEQDLFAPGIDIRPRMR